MKEEEIGKAIAGRQPEKYFFFEEDGLVVCPANALDSRLRCN